MKLEWTTELADDIYGYDKKSDEWVIDFYNRCIDSSRDRILVCDLILNDINDFLASSKNIKYTAQNVHYTIKGSSLLSEDCKESIIFSVRYSKHKKYKFETRTEDIMRLNEYNGKFYCKEVEQNIYDSYNHYKVDVYSIYQKLVRIRNIESFKNNL